MKVIEAFGNSFYSFVSVILKPKVMQMIYPLNNHWLAQTSYTVRGMSKTVSSKTNNVTVHWQLLGQINQEHQKAGNPFVCR
tara:strand:+ start:250 stop:492 length:243 start_codon:yes stop_codon:yes gene_type:complete